MPNSLNFRREQKVVLLEQVVVQKKFPDVPMIFSVSCGNPESRLSIPLWRVDWEHGSLQSCSLFQDRKISCIRQGIYFVL